MSSVKEEGVPTSEIPKIEFKPIFPIFTVRITTYLVISLGFFFLDRYSVLPTRDPLRLQTLLCLRIFANPIVGGRVLRLRQDVSSTHKRLDAELGPI